MVAEKTSGTPPGGFANDLAIWKSFLSIEFKASSACLTKGPAASNFYSVKAFFSSTSFLITAHLSASTSALLFSIDTLSFSILTLAANLSAYVFFISASTPLTFTYSSIMATCYAVYFNLIKPVSYLYLALKRSLLFCANILLNNFINSKNDLGVV